MSRSKRLVGALTRPQFDEPPNGGLSVPKAQLIPALVFRLLVLDVLPDYFFIAAHGGHKIPARPKVLPYKIPLLLAVDTRQMDRAFSFDVADHLRNRILRRDRDQHMHVVPHQMPLLDPALFLRCKLLKHLAHILPQFRVERLSPALRNENNVVFALPPRVT